MDNKNLAINTIRVLSAEAVQKANSGHPGLPLGAAPMAFTLWNDCMNHNPKNPSWFNRDRFILSAGHGSMLIYSLLHLFGYGLTIDDIKNFRQLDSLTPGHPEYGHTVGVEATTGPLGQGLAMAVGMALAESNLAARFNKEGYNVVDHYTYTIVGDGCNMEGITNEAASFAGTNKLSKLIVLYDSNNISIEGDIDIAFTENVRARYESLGWDTFFVEDGNNIEEIKNAIEKAKKTDKPSFIEIKTKIGYGSPKEGSASAHGEPLGEENIEILKKNIGWEYEEKFFVPEEVKSLMEDTIKEKALVEEKWNQLFEDYKKAYPQESKELEEAIAGDVSQEVLDSADLYSFEKDDATRSYSGIVINRLAEKIPSLIGGSADLAPSNKTLMNGREFYSPAHREGTNIHYGVREHAMAAMTNGIALHGGLIPFCGTFFVFSDYLKPSLRLSALMGVRALYVLTHDSIGVGEDGPTHEPIEQLAMLRSIPNLATFRPCDGKETAAAYSYGISNKTGPTAVVLTRQKLRNLDETGKAAMKGAYVLKDLGDKIDVILMASGSEVELIYDAADRIHKAGYGVRVVSMPSMDLFELQSDEYKDSVLPKDVRNRVSVECLSSFGWGRYVGLDGISIGMTGYGASAPANQLFEKFGFTVDNVVEQTLNLLK